MLPTPMLGGVTGLKEGGGTFYSLSPLLASRYTGRGS